jgi:hypothetical protein
VLTINTPQKIPTFMPSPLHEKIVDTHSLSRPPAPDRLLTRQNRQDGKDEVKGVKTSIS